MKRNKLIWRQLKIRESQMKRQQQTELSKRESERRRLKPRESLMKKNRDSQHNWLTLIDSVQPSRLRSELKSSEMPLISKSMPWKSNGAPDSRKNRTKSLMQLTKVTELKKKHTKDSMKNKLNWHLNLNKPISQSKKLMKPSTTIAHNWKINLLLSKSERLRMNTLKESNL